MQKNKFLSILYLMKQYILIVCGLLIFCNNCSPKKREHANPLDPKYPKNDSLGSNSLSYEERISFFDTYEIKGVGGEQFLQIAKDAGANTIRTWAIYTDYRTRDVLDEADNLGIKVILGFWMAHQGDNGGWQWDYADDGTDYYVNQLNNFLQLYGNHPAVLMWGLGNEVNISPEYLQCANTLSTIIHNYKPSNITCIVIVNAPQSTINAIEQYAPDIDMIGANSYGSAGVAGAINDLTTYWGKAYFISEYGQRGTWAVPNTSWGTAIEDTPQVKVNDLNNCHNAINNADANCKGSVVFLWQPFLMHTHTWWGCLLPENPEIESQSTGMVPYTTPYSDLMEKHFTGSYPDDRAPIISNITINGSSANSITLTAGNNFTCSVTATDPDGDTITYKWWVYNYNGNEREGLISGPYNTNTTNSITVAAPSAGTYGIMCYAIDIIHDSASALTKPFRTE